MRSCGVVLILILLSFSVFAEILPGDLEEISDAGGVKTFYRENDEKIEIFSCSLITINKSEVYPEEPEVVVEPEPEKSDSGGSDSDSSSSSPKKSAITGAASSEIPIPPANQEEVVEEVYDTFELEDSLRCSSSWFCSRWKHCFANESECHRIAQEFDCNYDKLYNLVFDCAKIREQEEITQEFSERQQLPLPAAVATLTLPLVSLFALDRYLKVRRQKAERVEEDKKIEEIKKKYSNE